MKPASRYLCCTKTHACYPTGLYGFDVRGPGFFRLHYWGDLLKVLRGKIGAEVFVTAVPG